MQKWQEYLPYVGRVVWIQYEVVEVFERIESTVPRVMVWGKWSWADSSSGPDWEPFRWQPFGLKAVS